MTHRDVRGQRRNGRNAILPGSWIAVAIALIAFAGPGRAATTPAPPPAAAAKGVPAKGPAAARKAARSADRARAHPDSAAVLALLDGVANASCPMRGIASGGQVSDTTVGKLAHAGFRTVLDLRGEKEPRGYDEAAAVKRAGLDYVSIPVTRETLDDSVFVRVRAFMQDAEHFPVMVHCASGNRVGVVLLPWLVLDRGWSLDHALEVAKRGGTHESPMKDKALAYIEAHRTGH